MKKSIFIIMVSIISACLMACGHTHEWEEATCTRAERCEECGKTREEKLGHDWEKATCTEPKTCERCGREKGEPKGHEWVFLGGICKETWHCERCGEEEEREGEHNWTEATCTEPEKCSYCGKIGEPQKEHNMIEATCTEAATCRECGEMQGEPLGHDVDMDYFCCMRCDEELVELTMDNYEEYLRYGVNVECSKDDTGNYDDDCRVYTFGIEVEPQEGKDITLYEVEFIFETDMLEDGVYETYYFEDNADGCFSWEESYIAFPLFYGYDEDVYKGPVLIDISGYVIEK